MATKLDHLRTLARVCRQFGGRLTVLSQSTFDNLVEQAFDSADDRIGDGLNMAPFTDAHALHWRKKVIYVVRGREQVGSIIHEMGHVFAAPHNPEHICRECREWDWLGWEIALARQIGAAQVWSRHNANYHTGEGGGGQWNKLSTKRRRAVVADRLTRARKIGVVDADGAPRSVR